jgi:Uma2 family endonuclease
MTLDEFLAWEPPDVTGATSQVIDGEPVAMVRGSLPRGEILSEAGALLGNHLMGREPCRAVMEPGIVPRFRADVNFRIADLEMKCEPLHPDQMIHQPVLLVEILTPSNETEIDANIWAFTTTPSIQEILSVHSIRIAASRLRRNLDGSWPAAPTAIGPADTLVLESIGFSVPLRTCYRTTFHAGT